MYVYRVKLFGDFLHQNTLILRALSCRFVQDNTGSDRDVEALCRPLHGDTHDLQGRGEFFRRQARRFAANDQRTRLVPIDIAERSRS